MLCGDGVVTPDEECDGSACCGPDCKFIPASNNTECRPAASDNSCDKAEVCTGTSGFCPPDEFDFGAECDDGDSATVTSTCTATGECKGLVTVDSPCDDDDDCDDGNECTDDVCTDGKCAVPTAVANGTTCDTGNFCTTGICADALCLPVDPVCTPACGNYGTCCANECACDAGFFGATCASAESATCAGSPALGNLSVLTSGHAMSLTLQQEMLPAQVECALARLLRAPAERFAAEATNGTSSERKRSTAHGVTIFDTDDENETSAEGLVDRFASLLVNGTDDAFAAAGFGGAGRPTASKGAAVTASPTPVPTTDGTNNRTDGNPSCRSAPATPTDLVSLDSGVLLRISFGATSSVDADAVVCAIATVLKVPLERLFVHVSNKPLFDIAILDVADTDAPSASMLASQLVGLADSSDNVPLVDDELSRVQVVALDFERESTNRGETDDVDGEDDDNSGGSDIALIVIIVLAVLLVAAVVVGAVLFARRGPADSGSSTSSAATAPEFASARDDSASAAGASGIYGDIALGDVSTADADNGSNQYGRISSVSTDLSQDQSQYAGFSGVHVGQETHYAPIE